MNAEDIKAYIIGIFGVVLTIYSLTQVVLPALTAQGSPQLLSTLGPLVVSFAGILAILRIV